MVTHAKELKDRWEGHKGLEWYSLTNVLVADHMDVVAKAKYAKAWKLLDDSCGWKAAAWHLEDLIARVIRRLKAGG